MKTPHRHAWHLIRGVVLLVLLVLAWQVIAADIFRVRSVELSDNTAVAAIDRDDPGRTTLVENNGR